MQASDSDLLRRRTNALRDAVKEAQNMERSFVHFDMDGAARRLKLAIADFVSPGAPAKTSVPTQQSLPEEGVPPAEQQGPESLATVRKTAKAQSQNAAAPPPGADRVSQKPRKRQRLRLITSYAPHRGCDETCCGHAWAATVQSGDEVRNDFRTCLDGDDENQDAGARMQASEAETQALDAGDEGEGVESESSADVSARSVR